MKRKVVPVEHLDCLELPRHLDRLYLNLGSNDRPIRAEVAKIARSRDPANAFAKFLVDDDELCHLRECWNPHEKSLEWRAETVTKRRILAAMSALYSTSCMKLCIGAPVPAEAASLLRLWTKLRFLTIHGPENPVPAIRVVQDQIFGLELEDSLDLEGLEELELSKSQTVALRGCPGFHNAGALPKCPVLQELVVGNCSKLRNLDGLKLESLPKTAMRLENCTNISSIVRLGAFPRAPKEFTIANCKSLYKRPGLRETTEVDPGIEHLDLYDQHNLPSDDLAFAARKVILERDGNIVWSSWRAMQSALAKGDPPFTEDERDIICSKAKAVAKDRLVCALKDVRDPYGPFDTQKDRVVLLKGAMAYASDFRISKDDEVMIDSSKEMMRLQVRQMAEEEPQSVMLLQTCCGNQAANKLRRAVAKVLCCIQGSERIYIQEGTYILSTAPWNWKKEDGEMLMTYTDTEQKGFITLKDLSDLHKHGGPATFDHLYEFYEFLTSKFKNLQDAFDHLAGVHDRTVQREISVWEFDSGLKELGWHVDNAHSLFATLDGVQRNGSITIDEFIFLKLCKNIQTLRRAEVFRDFCLEKYGSLKKAFLQMDDNDSGALSFDELQDFCKQVKYTDQQGAERAFWFIDTDHSGIVSTAEWNELAGLDTTGFLNALRKVRINMLNQWGSLTEAWDRIIAYSKNKAAGKLDEDTFERALRLNGVLKGISVDPVFLFQLLDGNLNGRLSKREFLLMDYFGQEEIMEAIAKAANKLWQMYNTPLEAFREIRRRARAMQQEAKEKKRQEAEKKQRASVMNLAKRMSAVQHIDMSQLQLYEGLAMNRKDSDTDSQQSSRKPSK